MTEMLLTVTLSVTTQSKIIIFGNKLKFYEKVNTYIWNNTVGLISL